MAASTHKKLEIKEGDLVVISASPIPGNEKLVSRVINELFKKGAEVIYESLADIHVSGHACQEELKLIHSLVRPKYFMPVHGEYRHLKQHAMLAKSLGMEDENIFIMSIGRVLEISKKSARINGNVPSGSIMVDGLGVGDVGNIVLRDRKHLAEDGLIVVVITLDSKGNLICGPDVLSRGFVYVRESEDLIEEVKGKAKNALLSCIENNKNGWNYIKNTIKEELNTFLYTKTKRNPMILPIVVEIKDDSEKI